MSENLTKTEAQCNSDYDIQLLILSYYAKGKCIAKY